MPMLPKSDLQTFVNGIFFGENSDKPEFVRIPLNQKKCDDFFSGETTSVLVPDYAKFLGNAHPGRSWMRYNPLKDYEQLEDTLFFNYRDNFFNDGSQPNRCIQKATDYMNYHSWAGPLFVYKENSDIESKFSDIEMKDFSNVLTFLSNYGTPGMRW
jgi:hypothetical protein